MGDLPVHGSTGMHAHTHTNNLQITGDHFVEAVNFLCMFLDYWRILERLQWQNLESQPKWTHTHTHTHLCAQRATLVYQQQHKVKPRALQVSSQKMSLSSTSHISQILLISTRQNREMLRLPQCQIPRGPAVDDESGLACHCSMKKEPLLYLSSL